MTDAPKANPEPAAPAIAPKTPPQGGDGPGRILLVPYPKIVFLYPTLLMSVLAAIYLNISRSPLDPTNKMAVVVNIIFLAVFALNLVVLAFDFPRATSLTLFFFLAAIVLGFVLLFTVKPHLMPVLTHWLGAFHPLADATFYWSFFAILGAIYLAALATVRFDYWEVRPNELLHHHGFLSNLERFSAPNLRIEKEINDVFEYLLLRSGRLILQPSDERRAIILENVPFIDRKEELITRMLGSLQVEVRQDSR
jgi:uncharacterized membrane protein YagU involved in acid resistance